ncbi:hypothetical protein [Octadecabacter antarcticus]|uniref:hypothetical protein n=1 Tax=Octadecabacter antarcticus TaxID=1217908 RepID=UPI001181C03F|nr:hypothetical protein [Octadecabacter antarcticus]
MITIKQRPQLRTLHLIGSGLIGWALYGNTAVVMGLAQWVAFPALALSGVWMWKQGAISRWLNSRAATQHGHGEE